MDIRIQANDFSLSPADEDYIRRRLYFELSRFQSEIDTVRVRLEEVPGFESEGISRILVEVGSADCGPVFGDSHESDLYVAIDRAAARVGTNMAGSVDSQAWAYDHFESTAGAQGGRPAARCGRAAA